MEKKRFLLAISLVIFLALSTHVFAGCCQGIIGCSRAFFETECSELATFDSQECEEIAMCDVVACCHNIPTMPKAVYRATCLGITPPPTPIYIKPFTTNPSAESAYANNICAGAKTPCTNTNCESSNTVGCMCGSAVTTSASQWCCSRDNAVFPTFGSCTSSPSCKVGVFYDISGQVKSPQGFGIAGADVRAGGKQVVSDSKGYYNITDLPDLSTGTVVAIKNNTINSTTYTISGNDLTGIDVVLNIVAAAAAGVEICDNGQDDDGDQFFWNSSKDGLGTIVDQCDSDCSATYGISISRSVTKTYYVPQASGGEYYNDTTGKTHDLCSDHFDNDCDGTEDCDDADCASSPSCQATYCGDGTIQFPNAEGVYEQCDYYVSDGVPITNSTGDEIGNDSLCPGSCLPPGDSKECTCKYSVSCGNSVIDAPLETCDGVFLASLNIWDPAKYSKSSKCTIDQCGKPNSAYPCQCPPKQECGNNKKESPEECDGTDDSACNDECSPDCTCPPEASVCGDNLIELDEDCDGVLSLEGDEWESFKTRKYGCSKSGCAVPKLSSSSSNKYYGPYVDDDDELTWMEYTGSSAYTDYKEGYAAYLKLLGTDTACTCATSCKDQPIGPKLKNLSQVRYERKILLNWSDDCMNENVKAYNIYRCQATDEDGSGCEIGTGIFSIINSAPLGVTNKYTDTNFEGSTDDADVYYCYYVEGIYDTVSPNSKAPTEDYLKSIFKPEYHCIKAGREECFEFHDFYPWASEFCAGTDNNVRSECDENNTVVEVNDSTEKTDCNEPDTGYGGTETYYVCVGPYANNTDYAGLTRCVPKSLCDYCNDPFGLFGYSSGTGAIWGVDPVKSLDSTGIGKAPKREPSDAEKESRSGYFPCFQLDFCYMDYSYTNVNKFYELGANPTCYDFHSLEACATFNETDGNCEWVWHPRYGELGIGICRTNITTKQECERCHDPENEVFGRCDRDSCALYGRCYYDKANLDGELTLYSKLAQMSSNNTVKKAQKESDTSYYKCTHEMNISCENYDSMEDCIGSASPYSVEEEENLTSNLVLDVAGNVSKGIFTRWSGTHEIVNRSDDFFNFGKCQWVSPYWSNTSTFDTDADGNNTDMLSNTSDKWLVQGCIKNSDDSPPEVDYEEGPGYSYYGEELYSDCGGKFTTGVSSKVVQNIRDCWKDFTAPVTSIPHYENYSYPMRISAKFSFPAVISDKSVNYSSYYPDTFACISEEDLSCYPNGTATKVSAEKGNLIDYSNIGYNVSYNFSESGFQSGRYTLRYYSEDISHNLEVVRNFTVYIDADAPNVSITLSNVSYELREDVWRTNLTLTMQIVQTNSYDDEYAFCDAKMYLGNVSIYPGQDIVSEYNDSWTMNYTGMPDDYYRFWYKCVDDVGNIAEKNVTIKIEGDRSITDPQPAVTVNSTSVVISVETGTDAECRYLLSVKDNSAFWDNATFDTSVFSTMTPFKVTGGSGNISITTHKSNVTLSHGYQRFYVKCKATADGKIRGNSADQIRFAVDVQAPITKHSTDLAPYNSWYNDDVTVYLSCGDPVVMGNSLDWSFGCNSTYYCTGQGCADLGYWENYSSGISLNETTNVSYYSEDNGGNEEDPTEDVLFQVDKVPPNISVEFYDGTTNATVIIPNIIYKIVVTSSKPFISPAIETPSLSYTSSPSKFAGTVQLYPTLNASVWEGIFFIELINANKDYEGNATFTVTGSDYHNVSGSGRGVIAIDTKPPQAPVLDPSLESPSPEASEYQDMGYPVNYYNGTYYTNSNSLFITGYTKEYLDVRMVTSVDGVDSERIFSQSATNMSFNDSILSGYKNSHSFRIAGDVTSKINSGIYAGFGSLQTTIGPKTAFGEYGMFYDITAVNYTGGDTQYTTITVYPSLESTLGYNSSVFFYDTENPSYWFGFNMSLQSFKNTTFYLKAYDASRNLIRYPDISNEKPYLQFFADPVAPTVVKSFPKSGSTSKTSLDVGIIVKEGVQESGLFNDSVVLKVNGKNVSYSIIPVSSMELLDNSSHYFMIYSSLSGLSDGYYTVSVTGYDFAMNSFDDDDVSATWTFNVDRSLPSDPEFTLVPGSHNALLPDRWVTTKAPDFIVDFSADSDPVTIEDVYVDDSPTQGDAANCTNTSFNVFYCEFTSQKTSGTGYWADYEVTVLAYKTLDDGTDSNTGNYTMDFTIDDQAPLYTLAFKNRFMDKIKLTIGAIVTNERYTLNGTIDILGETFSPIYSTNNGTFYYFVWSVPDYNSSQEGNTTMKITLTDFAGNSRSTTTSVYIDLTAPRITNISIDISNTIEIGTELFTSYPNVTVSGPLVDDDIDKVWIMPGDYNATTNSYSEKKYADLKYSKGIPVSFNTSVRLFDPSAGSLATSTIVYNAMIINQVNNMTLYVMDKAGHVSTRKLQVISDIAAPLSPTFCIGENYYECLPSSSTAT
ncbi:hypothetical protein KY363_00445 [Candidatus Woesearchaeota archaeon]|nr:hypothetical protein [Candidatus Woesearchaeota archaeon]